VKQAVLDSKYSAIVAEMLQEHLQKQNVTAAQMVHVGRKSIWEEQELLANVKIGDWVEVSYDYLPGTCSDGGIGIITALINVAKR
jgi:hypothetical protein